MGQGLLNGESLSRPHLGSSSIEEVGLDTFDSHYHLSKVKIGHGALQQLNREGRPQPHS
uniref:Uncharacterized protein n=1 Tax=Cucumis melo TaxID=3656 RepID=A0A9I9D6S0_CUCME